MKNFFLSYIQAVKLWWNLYIAKKEHSNNKTVPCVLPSTEFTPEQIQQIQKNLRVTAKE